MTTPKDPRKTIAVFDLDRTLLTRTSGEIQLIRYLVRRKILPVSNFIRYLRWMFTKLPSDFSEAVIRNKVYLAGLDSDEVNSHLPAFYEHHIQPRLSGIVQEWMEKLKERGCEIILLSATLDFILQFIAERLDIDRNIGSKMEVRGGLFTGHILGNHPYHHGKVSALLAAVGNTEVDFVNSYGFGDSWADVPLLSLFGNPVAVNPGHLLRREAKRRKWLIIKD
jgi:HAD superfamily hydrolase (TIGR01490 family)